MKALINDFQQRFKEFASDHNYLDNPYFSVYVDLDPSDPDNRRERPSWLIELKKEGKRLEDDLKEELKRRKFLRDWDKLISLLESELLEKKPGGKSAVIFYGSDGHLRLDLPVKFPNRIYYGIPQVKHLMFAMDQYKKYLTILFSGSDIKMMEVFLSRVTSIKMDKTKHEQLRKFGKKSKTLANDRRNAEFERRHVKEIADEINTYFLGDPEFERFILAGNKKIAQSVKRELHPAIVESLVTVADIDFNESDSRIADKVSQIAVNNEREHDNNIIDYLLSNSMPGGTALLERQGVENALKKGIAKKLIIPYPIDADEFDELIIEATLNECEIEFLQNEAGEKLRTYGGMGAVLF